MDGFTTASRSAAMPVSIFIASIVSSRSPWRTCAPGTAMTEATTPGMGAPTWQGLPGSALGRAWVVAATARSGTRMVRGNVMTTPVLRELTWLGRLPLTGPLASRSEPRRLAAQVEEVARTLRIEPLLGRKPGRLSAGQRRRAALGRAMVRGFAAFLMDSPLSNLDAPPRVRMRAETHRRFGRTCVDVTHDQGEALTMSSRVAVMKAGRILQIAPPAELYARPASVEVAAFVGSPAISLPAGERDAAGAVTLDGVPLPLRLGPGRPGPPTLGLRPE